MTREVMQQARVDDNAKQAITALREALAQPPLPVQEPVAFYHPQNGFYWAKPTSIFAPTVVDVPPMPLYTVPPAAQPEPMRLYVEDFARRCGWGKDSGEGAFEYVQRKSYAQGLEDATPPAAQRPWQGLTDEEIFRADPRIGTSDSNVNPYQILKSARAIEAMLKGKNYDTARTQVG